MARIILKEADVVKVMPGWGFKAQNTSTLASGETLVEKYTVWVKNFDPSMAPEGSVVNVEGLFSKKLETFENEQGQTINYAATHINESNVTLVKSQKINEAAIMDAWPTATMGAAVPEEVPF
jgi:hypothetical protein